MKFICDFEIHSRYARACSKNITLEEVARWAQIKGIKLIGTGDFTHPFWYKEIKEKLEEKEPGFFSLKDQFLARANKNTDIPIAIKKDAVRFLLTSEVNCIYPKNKKLRKVHHIILAPDLKTVDKINESLSWYGKLASDGRPTITLSSKNLLKIVLNANPFTLLIPAHVWTPWFGIFGSKSGYDSLEECFEEMTHYVYAIETGLSSDPEMNWRIPWLKDKAILSSSDAHSCPKIGREATCFNTEFNYNGLYQAIKSNSSSKIAYTIEFFPEEGKYHYDGHRNCNLSLSPEETMKYNDICPKCGMSLTLGVLNRVHKLGSQVITAKPVNRPPFHKIVPLEEVLSEVMALPSGSRVLRAKYFEAVQELGEEFKILIDLDIPAIADFNQKLAEAINKMRQGDIMIKPGYDGVFGEVRLFREEETSVKEVSASQDRLF